MSVETALFDAPQRFRQLLEEALRQNAFVRLTLGGYIGPDKTVKKLVVRPVSIRGEPHLSFVHRHTTRDITQNHSPAEALEILQAAVGTQFRHAHLSTIHHTAELRFQKGRPPQLILGKPVQTTLPSLAHDRSRPRALRIEQAPWLTDLGITDAEGKVRRGMESKLRQIEKFVELLPTLFVEARLLGETDGTAAAETPVADSERTEQVPWRLVDMGCGKGYLTFALYSWLQSVGRSSARVLGIDQRPELVTLGNAVATRHQMHGLQFQVGDIAGATVEEMDVLLALHACDTATDEALARGVQAGAALLLVSPCCHKEVRPQLRGPEVLRRPLQHGILKERQAEWVTDALRAALLDWAGYNTRVFEFVATEHTSKNLMITATRRRIAGPQGESERQARELAAFFGIQRQRLASRLGFHLAPVFNPVESDGSFP